MTFDLTLYSALALAIAGFFAGAVNAVAGGGTFFSFPVFLAVGLPPVIANASNAVSVWPGHALACVEYRRELDAVGKRRLLRFATVAGLGGALGAYALASVGNAAFVKLVPVLLLAATALFAFGPAFNRFLGAHRPRSTATGHIGIGLFAIYGGFFGAGLGIMLMAGLLLLGFTETHLNNAIKNVLATVVTTIAVLVLAASGLVAWPHTICAFVGALLGGLVGARIARRLSSRVLRNAVILLGCVLTIYYSVKYYVQ